MKKYIVTIFVNSGDKSEEWAQWNIDHTADLIKLPGFIASRAYRVRKDFLGAHPETLDTQPPYDFMNYYEVDEEGLKRMTTVARSMGEGPLGGTREFPAPLGPYVGHAFMWESIGEENHPPEQ